MSNKRQWYAIRQKLQAEGKWVGAKKQKTAGTKRPADSEEPSTSGEPPAKQRCKYGVFFQVCLVW